MNEGPTKIVTEHLSCIGCCHLVRCVVATGRHPIHDHACSHPDVTYKTMYIMPDVWSHTDRHIGSTDRTPDWCPFRKES